MTTEPLSLQGVLAVNVHASSPAASGAAGGAAAAPPSSSDKPAKPSGLASVASTANQILFKVRDTLLFVANLSSQQELATRQVRRISATVCNFLGIQVRIYRRFVID